MNEQMKAIGLRIAVLREVMAYSVKDLAQMCGISEKELAKFEAGERDFPFSFLYDVAQALDVDVLELMSGEAPKLGAACVVRRGGGYEINRRAGYMYKHLAYTFRRKKAEPFMVTVTSLGEEVPAQHVHDGQEFNYVISGTLLFYLDDKVYTLGEGDSIYFNAAVPHAMKAQGSECRFLAVNI